MALINSAIVTASLLLKLYAVLLLKILYTFVRVVIISRNVAFERVRQLKRMYVKAIQLFFSSETVKLRDGEPGDDKPGDYKAGDDKPGDESVNWLSQFVSVSFFHLKKIQNKMLFVCYLSKKVVIE